MTNQKPNRIWLEGETLHYAVLRTAGGASGCPTSGASASTDDQSDSMVS